jgi:hypothetical protein
MVATSGDQQLTLLRSTYQGVLTVRPRRAVLDRTIVRMEDALADRWRQATGNRQ